MNSAGEPAPLTVVIPAYNAAKSLPLAVRSAFAAGAGTVILVDDGSTDDTAKTAEALGCVVISQTNQGAAVARRRGIDAADTDFVVLLDADDQLVPQGVRKSVELLQESPEAVAAQGVTIGVGHGQATRNLEPWPEGVSVSSLLARGHASGPPAAFVWRRWALQFVIGEELEALWPRYAEDYEFLVRGASHGRILTHHDSSCVYMWVGGKSGGAPAKSVADAERIRLHYANLIAVNVEPRRASELRSMVWMRKASAHIGLRSFPKRILYTTAGLLSDQRAISSRVRRRFARNTTVDGSRRGRRFTREQFASFLREDIRANPRDPKALMIMTSLRATQLAMGDLDHPRRLSIVPVIAYRLLTEFVLGVELRPKTSVGPGLAIFHGTGLVVNDHAVIGRNVTLRNGVTIGHLSPGGGSPRLGDHVEVGASALILGNITVGDGAVIGAGSVVVKPVEPYTSVAGNPARKLRDLPGPML